MTLVIYINNKMALVNYINRVIALYPFIHPIRNISDHAKKNHATKSIQNISKSCKNSQTHSIIQTISFISNLVRVDSIRPSQTEDLFKYSTYKQFQWGPGAVVPNFGEQTILNSEDVSSKRGLGAKYLLCQFN